MSDEFRNAYDDERRARAYTELKFPGAYFLAFRDLPEIFGRHVSGSWAIDFGCGTGRSTGFLRRRVMQYSRVLAHGERVAG
jgi:hypothetical protein